MITMTLAAGTEGMSPNMVKGINALRCAFLNGFIQTYLLVAAAYYAARQFGQEAEVQSKINEYYPYLCTCNEDVATLSKYMGGSSQSTAEFEKCV